MNFEYQIIEAPEGFAVQDQFGTMYGTGLAREAAEKMVSAWTGGPVEEKPLPEMTFDERMYGSTMNYGALDENEQGEP